MKKNASLKRVLFYQIAGFFLLITLVWVSEILDLPHSLLNAPPTPSNIIESIYESIFITGFAAIIIIFSHKTIKRINYLEGFLPVCSFCKKIRIKDEWIPIDIYIENHSDIEFSHSLCPECAEKHYGDLLHKT